MVVLVFLLIMWVEKLILVQRGRPNVEGMENVSNRVGVCMKREEKVVRMVGLLDIMCPICECVCLKNV